WLLRSKPVTVRTAPVASATNEIRPSGWRWATNAWPATGTTPTDDGGEPSARVWTMPVRVDTTCTARAAATASPPSSAAYAVVPSGANAGAPGSTGVSCSLANPVARSNSSKPKLRAITSSIDVAVAGSPGAFADSTTAVVPSGAIATARTAFCSGYVTCG